MSALRIRPATPGDAPALARVLVASGRRAWPSESLQDEPDAMVIVAELDGELVAGARTWFAARAEPIAPAGHYLGGLVVHPDARRRGVGRALLAARLGRLAARTAVVHSVVNAANVPSLALHRGAGFVEIAHGPRFQGVVVDRAGDELVLLRLLLGTPDGS